jgi:hypothetical protein
MSDIESESENEQRFGYTPVHEAEGRDMRRPLAEEAVRPALEASAPGLLVTA